MQRLQVSGAVRPLYGSLGVKRLNSEITNAIYRQPLLGSLSAPVTFAVLLFKVTNLKLWRCPKHPVA